MAHILWNISSSVQLDIVEQEKRNLQADTYYFVYYINKLIMTFLTIFRRLPTTSRKSPKIASRRHKHSRTSSENFRMKTGVWRQLQTLTCHPIPLYLNLCRSCLNTSYHRPGPVYPRVFPNVGWPLNNKSNNLQLTFSALGPTKKCKNLENAP